MTTIKTLRASGSQLRADVVVGANKYGSDVTVQVQLSRSDPEVAEALEPLSALLTTRAQNHIDHAAIEQTVQRRVREEVDKKAEAAKARALLNADTRVANLVGELKRQLSTFSGTGDMPAALVSRLMSTLERESIATAGKVPA